MTPIQTYRITSNFVTIRGIDRLKQFEDDLNSGLSVERIASTLLHCSVRRAYVLKDAIFQQVYVLKDSAREFVENNVKSEQCKIERAIKFSQHNIENKKLDFILCGKNYKKSESV
jgi:hypothetical protein